jgi:arylsulfatase A-like enzyme
LLRNEPSARKGVFYYRGPTLYAARLGDYKMHFKTQGAYGMFGGLEEHEPPLLYNVNQDPSENYNIANENPEILSEINRLVKDHQANLIVGEDQLADRE